MPPVLIGIVFSLALGGFALWFSWFVGIIAEVAAGRSPDIAVRAPVTLYVMVGYLPMAIYYLSGWTSDHLDAINRLFNLDSKSADIPRWAMNCVGAAGLVTMYFLFLHRIDDPFLLFAPLRWKTNFAFPLVGLSLMGWFNLRFLFLLIWSAVTVSRTARHIENIDLLDTSLVRPYGMHGVRSSLLAIVSLSISANLWLDPESPTNATAISLIMLVAATVVALILPTWGIHLRLKTLKESELKQIRSVIWSKRKPVARSVDDALLLQADLALEQRLMAVSEWPFDAGNYGRVALYVFLGFSSWVVAA